MSIKPSKVGIVGAGNVGAAIANALVLLGKSVTIVLFVGASHILGQTRLDLLAANATMIYPLVPELDRVAPDAIAIAVSNPVDVLTQIALETSTRLENLIFGSGTVLDTARLQYQLGKVLNLDKSDVHVQVIGEHGESQFPVWSNAAMSMIPLTKFPLPKGTALEQIRARFTQVTRDRGDAILNRNGHTSYGVAIVVAQLVDAILRDEKRMFTVSARADPAYGVGNEVVLGLPCIIGKHGIESHLVLPRNKVEQNLLKASATKLHDAYQTVGRCNPALQTVA